ncbi:serine hydrolase domain-containing protein [Burkholderia aenigmatica]|uniref:serine hydrolase domain-containing protein n=1 Tax=Burkholderia aenigmatica TaxID=2015348 RepID=UPI003B4375CE
MTQPNVSGPLPRKSPFEVGVSSESIRRFLDAIRANGVELHNFMMLRHGAVVAEGAWHPYKLSNRHMQHSATKSWTGAAVGLLVDDGAVRLDDPVIDYFPEHLPEHVSENLAAMTVRDLLTMRTGHRVGISGGEWRGRSESWVRLFLDVPVEDKPGQNFMYGSGPSYMLSAIVSKATGKTAHELLDERMFEPLGINTVSWDLSPEGYNTGGNGISCSPEDMAKFGLLHLQGGAWHGRRILSEEWVRDATHNQVDQAWLGTLTGMRFSRGKDFQPSESEKRDGYGYQWWMTKEGCVASGFFGQRCYIFPELDVVLVFNSALPIDDKHLKNLIWMHLLPAVDGSSSSLSVTTDNILAAELGALALPGLPSGEPAVDRVSAISGRRWLATPNDDHIEWISLEFERNRCLFSLKDHRGEHVIEVGLGKEIESVTTMTGNKLHHEYQPALLRVVAEGVWTSPERFLMNWRFIETTFCDTVVCTFDETSAHFERSVNTNSAARVRPVVIASIAN